MTTTEELKKKLKALQDKDKEAKERKKILKEIQNLSFIGKVISIVKEVFKK